MDFSKMKQLPGGLLDNQTYLSKYIKQKSRLDENLMNIMFDPQTSGGLLISISNDNADELLNELKENGYIESSIVGEMTVMDELAIEIV